MKKIVYVVRFVNGPSIIVDKDPLGGCTSPKLIEYDEHAPVAGTYKETVEVRINIGNITYTQPRLMEVRE